MIYTAMTKKAMKLAYEAHQGQRDKNGMEKGLVLPGSNGFESRWSGIAESEEASESDSNPSSEGKEQF